MTTSDEEVGKLFIGGVDKDTTEEEFKLHFGHYGEMIDCVLMKDADSDRNRGFGFVKYKDPANADYVLSSGDVVVNGKKLDPKKCTPRGANQRSDRKPNDSLLADADTPHKIFIGGVPQNINERDLTMLFSRFGQVSAVKLAQDIDTKRNKGFGFVSFMQERSAQDACKEHFVDCGGKQVECKPARKAQKAGMKEGGGFYGGDFGNQQGGGNWQGGQGAPFGGYVQGGGGPGWGGPPQMGPGNFGNQGGGGGYNNQGNFGNQGGFGGGGGGYGGGQQRGGNQGGFGGGYAGAQNGGGFGSGGGGGGGGGGYNQYNQGAYGGGNQGYGGGYGGGYNSNQGGDMYSSGGGSSGGGGGGSSGGSGSNFGGNY